MYCFNRISCLSWRWRHYFATNQWEALWAGRYVQPRPRCSPASIWRLQRFLQLLEEALFQIQQFKRNFIQLLLHSHKYSSAKGKKYIYYKLHV